MIEPGPPIRRGEFVILTVEGRAVEAFVGLASPTGASLIVFFDAILDGCVGAMPLAYDGQGYRNVMSGRPVHVERRTPPGAVH